MITRRKGLDLAKTSRWCGTALLIGLGGCASRQVTASFSKEYDSDLEVGEPLYTLGSPSGLELSLSNGVLSGLREHDGQRLVQTTTPISPGSSGGGLFDARGNLVGITALVLVGKDRINQALNFAVPAEAFFQP